MLVSWCVSELVRQVGRLDLPGLPIGPKSSLSWLRGLERLRNLVWLLVQPAADYA